MKTIKTIIHSFDLDLRDRLDKAVWDGIWSAAEKNGVHPMHAWGGKSFYLPWAKGREVDLETGSLFANQWNTTPIEGVSEKGYRVFDLAYDAFCDSRDGYIRRGHYLLITDEMKEIRQQVQVCGYCGASYGPDRAPIPPDGFCPKCLGSEDLKVEQLHLLRLRPVAEYNPTRESLGVHEWNMLVPRYRDAQKHGSDERTKAAIVKRRVRAFELPEKAMENVRQAEQERDARLWCLDRGLLRCENNLIFYSHTGRFCFGWSKPMEGDDLDQLLANISEFHWPYEIKCADGRTLSGN